MMSREGIVAALQTIIEAEDCIEDFDHGERVCQHDKHANYM